MSIALNNSFSFNSRKLPDVTPNSFCERSSELHLTNSSLRNTMFSGQHEFENSANQGQLSEKVDDASYNKRGRAKKLLSKWKKSVKQKLHITDYNENGVFTHNQGTATSVGDLKDALSCYYKFKSDESKIEEMFETIMFKNSVLSPPVSRDQELRGLVPFEIISEQKLADLKKKLDVFSNCLSVLDDDKPWSQTNGFNSPIVDMKSPGSAIGGSGSPTELVSGILTLDSGQLSESIDKNSFCQISSDEEFDLNDSTESLQESRYTSTSAKSLSIVEKLSSFKNNTKISEVTPTESSRINSPSDNEFEVQKLVIPTFRMSNGKNMDISNIVENLKSGTITERDLLYLASMYTSQEVGFMDKSFYDDKGTEPDNEFPISCDNEQDAYIKQPIGIDDNNDSVKFDRFSYLVIYNASKKCAKTPLNCKPINNRPGTQIRNGNDPDSGYDGDDEDAPSIINITGSDDSFHKSILKSKNNDKEFLESQRAVKCDKVGVDEFLEFFEKYENERREGEYVLSIVRDKQLSNYYSKEYFPELSFQNHGVEMNTEFAKSKLATEHNIGRELIDTKTKMSSCSCMECSEDAISEADN